VPLLDKREYGQQNEKINETGKEYVRKDGRR
jgi:hypothetical protein